MSPFRALVLLLALLASGPARAQEEKGRIAGRVTEAATGDELPGANIVVKGTYYGGSSDLQGNFKVERVNPGSYTVEVTLLGYKTMQFTSVKVTAGQTTTLAVKMEETVLSLDKEIVVVGEKPLFDIEETASRRGMNREDIEAAAVQTVQGIVGLQSGVVQTDNEIHIRGGRAHENSYMLDGVSVQDPMAGTGFGMQVSPAAIQEVEVITGGYNAEYGQATSGIVNITTREGAERYAGSVSYRSDRLAPDDSRANWNTDILDLTLSGPEPITTYLLPELGVEFPGTLSFFGTLSSNLSENYTRWVERLGAANAPVGYESITPKSLYSSIYGGTSYAPRRSNIYSALAKFTYRPDPNLKFSYTFNESVVIDQNTQTVQSTLERVEPNPGYQYLFQYIPDSANTFTQRNLLHTFSLTHTLSKQVFYELRVSRYTAHVRGDANGKNFDAYIEPADIVTYPITYYNEETDTVGVVPGDGFYDVGSPTSWRDHFVKEWTVKADVTSLFSELNRFKAGFEVRAQAMQIADIVRPWVNPGAEPPGYDNDVYSVYPAIGSFYAQDNITLSGMILNFGVRLDWWAPGKYVDDVAEDTSSALIVPPALRQEYLDETFSVFGTRVKARLSPRLGISHPISDNQTLFFSYGHFSKFPRPQFVYSKLNRTSVRSSLAVGNPALDPETTVAYELGIRNQISGNDVLTVTAYYKDIFDYITEKSVRRLSGTGGSQFYTTYLNSDYARVRGLEVEYKTRFGNWFRGTANASYSIATGKSSTPNEDAVRIQQGAPETIRERYLIWDRPFQMSLAMNFTAPKGEPFFGFAPGILDDYNIFLRIFLQSGKRYTPQTYIGENAVTGRPEYISNIERELESVGQNWLMVDLNIDKYFDLGFGKLVASLEIQNLLDRKNSQIINPVTGRAYEYGDQTPSSYNDPLYPQLTGDISPFPYNPARYLSPRTVRLGLSFRF